MLDHQNLKVRELAWAEIEKLTQHWYWGNTNALELLTRITGLSDDLTLHGLRLRFINRLAMEGQRHPTRQLEATQHYSVPVSKKTGYPDIQPDAITDNGREGSMKWLQEHGLADGEGTWIPEWTDIVDGHAIRMNYLVAYGIVSLNSKFTWSDFSDWYDFFDPICEKDPPWRGVH